MFRKISYLFMALWVINATAQQYTKPVAPVVSVNDFTETRSPLDTTASAAYLYRYGNTYYELSNNYWVMVTEVYTRIKIYNKEGYDYANAQLDFYSGSSKAKGKFISANTYNYENGRVVKTPAQEESQFEQELDEDFTRKTITLPNVKEGSIIEYTTKVTTPYFSNLEDWYFQYDIPAVDVRYDIRIPIYFVYNIYMIGYVPIEKNENPPLIPNGATNTKEFYYYYTAKNVKPFKDEAYVSNPENYIGKLQHELSIVQMPNQKKQNYATSWEDMARKIYAMDGFGSELKKEGYFKDDLTALLSGLTDEESKMKAVFKYVQRRMNWNGRSGYYCQKGVKTAYKETQGNVADINLMLIAMLREAGFDANPVVLSTRKHGIAIFPSRYAYNYVIAAVKLGDKTVLLDASSKYTTPGVLPTRTLNWVGRQIKKNGDNQEIDLMPQANSKELITILASIDSNGTVTGKARDQYMLQRGYVYREKYAEMNKDSYLEKMERDYPGLEVSEYKMINQDEPEKPLIEEYSFTHNNVAEVIGDKIYLNPMLYLTRDESPFKAENREYPIDFIYPREDKYSINFVVPEGYKVESLPQGLNIGMEQNLGNFKYTVGQNGGIIQVNVLFTINHASIPADYYTTLKDFFSKMIEKQNEKIVFKKV